MEVRTTQTWPPLAPRGAGGFKSKGKAISSFMPKLPRSPPRSHPPTINALHAVLWYQHRTGKTGGLNERRIHHSQAAKLPQKPGPPLFAQPPSPLRATAIRRTDTYDLRPTKERSMFYIQAHLDRETAERIGAAGTFQVASLEDDQGNDLTYFVDQGVSTFTL